MQAHIDTGAATSCITTRTLHCLSKVVPMEASPVTATSRLRLADDTLVQSRDVRCDLTLPARVELVTIKWTFTKLSDEKGISWI